MYLADILSRDCANGETENEGEEFEILNLTSISTHAEMRIRDAISSDETLKLVCQYVKDGWPQTQDELPSTLRPYWSFETNYQFSTSSYTKARRS